MQYRKLGASGLRVSEIGLGSYLTYGQALDRALTRACVFAALDAGINFFDTADGYGESEALLGALLRERPRTSYVVATKCFFPQSDAANDRGLSRKHVVESVERALTRLGLDYVDLMQCHRFDPETPLEETVRALDDLTRQGKVLYWGVCRFSAEQTRAAAGVARALGAAPPIGNQWPYNLFNRDIEAELLGACQAAGVGVLAYYPLAQGVLSGKYDDGRIPPGARASSAELRKTMWDYQPDKLERARRFGGVARSLDLTPAQAALAWCLRQPAISAVLVGASRPEQLAENARASELKLDAAALARLEEAA
ncbi:MAG TPA: aldo/keto reductase family protein [Polyangia bacterium]|nr:aldo/keto reductase family protein [Polyangia bacterium]